MIIAEVLFERCQRSFDFLGAFGGGKVALFKKGLVSSQVLQCFLISQVQSGNYVGSLPFMCLFVRILLVSDTLYNG